MTSIAIIPARGGSQRIPRKNIREFHGKPIIAYSIEVAKASGLFSDIIVSTDDHEINAYALNSGVQVFLRDPDDGTRGTQEVTREAVAGMCGVHLVCCIYPTAPLIDLADLKDGPFWMRVKHASHVFAVGTDPLCDAGQFYWHRWSALMERSPLIQQNTVMIPVKPERLCDINTEEDWQRAERMYEQLHNKEEA